MWRRLSSLPGGARLFSWFVARRVPYSGSVHPRVLALEPGYARVLIADRRGIRNHLHSIHAIALANVGEFASGLAMTVALPPGVRGIVTAIRVRYLKKARGPLIAESRCVLPEVTHTIDFEVAADIVDADRDVVASVAATWRLSPANTK